MNAMIAAVAAAGLLVAGLACGEPGPPPPTPTPTPRPTPMAYHFSNGEWFPCYAIVRRYESEYDKVAEAFGETMGVVRANNIVSRVAGVLPPEARKAYDTCTLNRGRITHRFFK